MLACPTCSKRLARSTTSAGPVYQCRSCGGRAVAVNVLRKTAGEDFLRRLRHTSTPGAARRRPCPLCDKPMALADYGAGARTLQLDVCKACRIVWFDPAEYARATSLRPAAAAIAVEAPPPLPEGPGDDGPPFALGGPEHAWQILPAIFGLPIEYGENRLRNLPVLTWGISGVLMLLTAGLYLQGGYERLADVIQRWGFIPSRSGRHNGMTLLTSFLLHAGWWHVIANVYFLIIFGDNVEDHLGRWRFLLLLAGSHLCGMALHAALTPAPDIPCVGASAGISGVIAYYAVVFPRAKIGIFAWLFTLFRILRMPAVVGLILYAAVQFIGAYFTRHGGASVAYLAHLGGLAAGAVVGLLVLGFRDKRGR